MNRAKVVVLTLLAMLVAVIFVGGCNFASFGSSYSSGPPGAGEGTDRQNSQLKPKPGYGTVAGGGYTGNVTSGGATGDQYGRG